MGKRAGRRDKCRLVLVEWEDSLFDYVIENGATLAHLELVIDSMMAVFSGRILPYSEEQKDVPPFMRGR